MTSWREQASQLPMETVEKARARVANDPEFLDYLGTKGGPGGLLGDHPTVIEKLAAGDSYEDALGVYASGWRARGLVPDNQPKEIDHTSFGSFLMGPK